MSGIRGLLFDKDGTLIDFHASWGGAVKAVADLVANLAGDAALADRLLGDGGYDTATGRLDPASLLACGTNQEIVEQWSRIPAVARIPQLHARVVETFAEYAAHAVPVTDLPALFKRFRKRGLKLGVATNDHTAATHTTLDALGATPLLDFVAGADAGYGGKPGPGMLVGFCQTTGLAPREVAVVGDTVADIGMARAGSAGLAVGVLSGVSPHATLASIADHVLDSIVGLEDLLDRLAPAGSRPN